ncbi:hypothetical protein AB0N09_35885 [Streptomyces erythrochromogenes]|uniref:hypothetical protein n=1 Tax=Streptomyces erythrochromogenes TaxID=285574 RepID=UPI0034476E7A
MNDKTGAVVLPPAAHVNVVNLPAEGEEYKGRRIEWRAVETERHGTLCTVVTYALGGSWEADGRPRTGMPNQSAASLVSDLKGSIDAVDRTFSPHMHPDYYRPGTVEPCPRTAGQAYGQHIKPVGENCPESRCVTLAKKKARAKSRATGITASSLSGLLAKAGFGRAELRHDGTARTVGFSVQGEDHNARVAIMWHGERTPGVLPGELPRIAAQLQRLGFRVERGCTGGHLTIYPKGSAGSGEGEYTEVDAESAAGWQPHAGSPRWDIRYVRSVMGRLFTEGSMRDGTDGWQVHADGWGVSIQRVQGSHITQPRAGRQRDVWDAALAEYLAHAVRSGLRLVRKNAHCIVVSVHVPSQPQTLATIAHTGVLGDFTKAIAFDGQPDTVAGRLELCTPAASPRAFTYLYDADGVQLGQVRDDIHGAEILAHHYGLPMPVVVAFPDIERRRQAGADRAAAVVDAEQKQTESGGGA